MTAELDISGNQVLSALLNGLYQGLFLSTLLWLGLKILSRTNATTRYAVEFLTLLLIAALPLSHLLRLAGPLGAHDPQADRSQTQPPANPAPFTLPSEPSITTFNAAAHHPDLSNDQPDSTPFSRVPARDSSPLVSDLHPKSRETDGTESPAPGQDIRSGSLSALAKPLSSADAGPESAALSTGRTWQPALPSGTSLILIGLWFGFASLRLWALGRQYGLVHTLNKGVRDAY